EGSLSASVTAFQAAVREFASAREAGNLASLHGLLAYDLHLLGWPEEAWRELLLGLNGSAELTGSQVRSLACETAAQVAEAQGDGEGALAFRDELLRSVEAGGRSYAVAAALRGRATLLAAMDRGDEALADLSRASRLLPLLPDPTARRGLQGDILLVEG